MSWFSALLAALGRTKIPEFDTAGDSLAPPPIPTPEPEPAPAASLFPDGWYPAARLVPAHPGRVGGRIVPWGVVVHTTDMMPATFGALVRAWAGKAGRGACAHFLIDRDGSVVQMVPIDRNANHAGGDRHGWYKAGARLLHPNRVTVGIEVHAAGNVRQRNGKWYHEERELPASEIMPDPKRLDRGWHGPTAAQFAALEALLSDLDRHMPPVPAGVTIEPNGKRAPWQVPPAMRVVGHCSLDPDRKSDPGIPGMAWIRTRTY